MNLRLADAVLPAEVLHRVLHPRLRHLSPLHPHPHSAAVGGLSADGAQVEKSSSNKIEIQDRAA